MKARQKRK